MRRQAIVISDTHCNSTFGLCRPEGHKRDKTGDYHPSKLQLEIWRCWEHFWTEWVPNVTRGEPWDLVINGDAIDGDHHQTPEIISRNMTDQHRAARDTLQGCVNMCKASGGSYYHVRGTFAHVGQSAANEELLAEQLGAVQGQDGAYSHYRLKLRLGHQDRSVLVQFRHHIGTSFSPVSKGTALVRAQAASYYQAGKWKREIPQFKVFSHRHTHGQWLEVGADGKCIVVVTPGWQGITPWAQGKADILDAEFGGILIRVGDEEAYIREQVYCIEQEDEVFS